MKCPQCGTVTSADPPDWSLSIAARHLQLLSSNEPPEDTEAASVRSAVSNVVTRLVSLDEEIAALRNRLRELEDKHDSLSRFHRQSTWILSPLRRMPAEILLEIFSWTMPPVALFRRRAKFGLKYSRVLTHISRRWRSVSISDPSLWSLVAINYRMDSDPGQSFSQSMVENQIARAQKLKIHFYGYESSDSRPQVGMLELLAKYSSQWEELSLGLTAALVPVLAGVQDRIPSLRRLHIQWDTQQSQAGITESLDFFQSAPSLIDASIYNEFRSVLFMLPWQNLTRYLLDAPWDVHHLLLKMTPNLVEARISIAFDPEPWPDFKEITDLIFLRRLFISHAEILDYLTTPHLEELAIDLLADEPAGFINRLLASSCPLRILTLAGGPTLHPMTEILRNFPSIVELRIAFLDTVPNTLVDELLSHLTVTDTEPDVSVLAPQLSGIHFAFMNGEYRTWDLCLEMIKSRWSARDCALKSSALLTDSTARLNLFRLQGYDVICSEGLDLGLFHGQEALAIKDMWLYSTNWN
ncbi:hypothetical protein DFH06DRAFT_574628 [Mycena polygramma]|nr:hypothetical protein DFH06DRAFT_574628 [Mycena polygramma]